MKTKPHRESVAGENRRFVSMNIAPERQAEYYVGLDGSCVISLIPLGVVEAGVCSCEEGWYHENLSSLQHS